ncbi:hypothetical protein GF360_02560 [candidate division WWE3 bacterium]|nr:hypothetical protein [candidate division WWE3 bacterium]
MQIEEIANLINDLDTKLNTKIDALRKELKEDIKSVRTDLKEDIIGVKTNLKEDIKAVKANLKEDIIGVKTDLKTDIKGVKTDLKSVKGKQTKLANKLKQVENDLKNMEKNLKEEIKEIDYKTSDERFQDHKTLRTLIESTERRIRDDIKDLTRVYFANHRQITTNTEDIRFIQRHLNISFENVLKKQNS